MRHESPHAGGFAESGRAAADSTRSVPPTADTMPTMTAAVANVLTSITNSTVVSTNDIGAYAVELALAGWEILPLRGKVPAIPKWKGGRGFEDATTDVEQVVTWWSGPYADANIGARVPDGVVVIDVDPRHDGDLTLTALVQQHGRLPATLRALSGRGDGGAHLYFADPCCELSSKNLPGIDVKTRSGYMVMPPSLHPETRKRYRWGDLVEIAPMPSWLRELLRRPDAAASRTAPRWLLGNGNTDGLLGFVKNLAAGNRNNGLHWAANRAADKLTGAELDEQLLRLAEAATTTGLPEREAHLTIRSVCTSRGVPVPGWCR